MCLLQSDLCWIVLDAWSHNQEKKSETGTKNDPRSRKLVLARA